MADPQHRLYRVSIPYPNPAIAEWLKGPAALAIVESKAAELYSVYEAHLPVRTTRLGAPDRPAPGHLKRSAYYRVGRGGWDESGYSSDRWFAWVGNTAWYAPIIEWGSKKRNIRGQHTLARAAAMLWGGFEGSMSGHQRRSVTAYLNKKPQVRKESAGELRAKRKADRNAQQAEQKARRADRKARAEIRKRQQQADAFEKKQKAPKSEKAKRIREGGDTKRKPNPFYDDPREGESSFSKSSFGDTELFEGVATSLLDEMLERQTDKDPKFKPSRAERQLLQRYLDA